MPGIPDFELQNNLSIHSPKTVAIVIRHIPQYRKEFYYGLKDALDKNNIILKVIYGQPTKLDMLKKDTVEIPWGIRIKNYILQLGDKELYWQPFFQHIKGVDLVIVESGSRLLSNYFLILFSKFSGQKVAFWGHGGHPHKSRVIPLSEWIKRIISRRVDWHFAYTESSAKVIRGFGYPADRITLVQNAIDTKSLVKAKKDQSEQDLINLKNELGLTGNHIGLFVGAMYKIKKIDFLLDACMFIRQQVPDFEVIMIGSGVDSALVVDFEKKYPWLHYVGPKFGDEKVPYFLISKLLFMPAAVGLAIIDSFALGLPLLCTQDPDNGHEIDYLINGVNGVMVLGKCTSQEYALVAANLLLDEIKLRELADGCTAAAQSYNIETMIANFTDGILDALNSLR